MGCLKLEYHLLPEGALEKNAPYFLGSNQNGGVPEKRLDYFTGGSVLPGRSFTSESYRYGFNGMEKDDEVKGNGNSYDFGARIYDPRIVRWLSIDPLAAKFPDQSPYNFVANNPIIYVDPDGRDIAFYLIQIDGDGNSEIKKVNFNDLSANMKEAVVSFANTSQGQGFLAQFARKGDQIGNVVFDQDGENANHILNVSETDYYGAGAGASSSSTSGKTVAFNLTLNLAYGEGGEDTEVESLAITAGHEAFIHIEQYAQELIDAVENEDWDTFEKIKNERKAIGRDRRGGPEHDAYLADDPAFSKMDEYSSELEDCLGQEPVRRAKEKHDQKLEGKKTN